MQTAADLKNERREQTKSLKVIQEFLDVNDFNKTIKHCTQHI